jgi:polysaccharide pyruvyl transferase WcaK-like protein
MPKTFFMTFRGPGNMGDVILKTNLSKLLSGYGKLVCLVADGAHRYVPDAEFEAHEVIWSFSKSFCAALLERKMSVYVILTPGGGGNSMRGFFPFIARCLMLLVLRLVGVKILQIGVSAEKALPGQDVYFSLESRLKNYTGYRDSISLEKAKARHEMNIGYFPDLSFPLWDKTARYRALKRDKSFLISLRTPILETDGKYEATLNHHIAKLSEHLDPDDVTLFNQVDDDIPVQERLSKQTGWRFHRFDEFPYSLESIYSLYGQHKYIISNRLHALLFGSFCGCIPIPIISRAENGKIAGIFEDMQLSELCFDIESENNGIIHHLAEVSSRSSDYLTRLEVCSLKSNDEILRISASLFGPSEKSMSF